MSSIYVGETYRKQITNRALEFAFKKREAALRKREIALCKKAHAHLYSKRHVDVIKTLPRCWHTTSSDLRFRLGALYNYVDLKPADPLVVPANAENHGYGHRIENTELIEELQIFADDRKALKDEKNALFAKVEGFLRTARTLKQLAELWPEGSRFYADIKPETKLPAVRTEDMNKALGLT